MLSFVWWYFVWTGIVLSFCVEWKAGQNGASGHHAAPAVMKAHKFVQDRVRRQTVTVAAVTAPSTTLETAAHCRTAQVTCLFTFMQPLITD